jgi:hypothetical protein
MAMQSYRDGSSRGLRAKRIMNAIGAGREGEKEFRTLKTFLR